MTKMNDLKLGTPALDRMPPIPDAQMSAEQKRIMDEIAAGPRGRIGGPFIPLMRSPELMDRLQKVGEYLRFQNAVGFRNSEFAVLIVARHFSQPVEWAIHRPIAEREGVLPATCDAIAEGRPPHGLVDSNLGMALHRWWHGLVGFAIWPPHGRHDSETARRPWRAC